MPIFAPPQRTAFLCYFLALLSGAAIMMIEIGGARLLNPFFGVSLYVWTSQIAVVMLALSLGYWRGGKLADKYPSFTAVRWLLTLTSLYLLVLPWLAPHLLRFFGGWGLRQGALISASVLFGPPLLFLGALSPYLLRLLSDSLSTLGKKVGGLYALSTLGSMGGTVAIGYYLLPALGAHKMIYLISLGLILSVLFLLIFVEKKILPAVLLGILPLVLLWMLFRPTPLISKTFTTPRGPVVFQELYQVDSFYGKIKVVEIDGRYRSLLVNGAPQAEMDIITNKNTLEYIEHMRFLGKIYNPNAKNALFLGLGAGSLEQDFRKLGLKTMAVEIDPLIIKAARSYFNWGGASDLLRIEDARFFLEKARDPFDLIFLDCFSGEDLPFHLLSQQSLARMQELLSPSGVLIINFPSLSRQSSPLAATSLTKTLQVFFPFVKVYAGFTYQQINAPCNYIFVASRRLSPFINFREHKYPSESAAPWTQSVEFYHPQAHIIDDNFNPMDVYEQEAREIFRRRILDIINWDFLLH